MEHEVEIYLFLFVGMLTLALLAGAVVIFFIFYQKKMLRQQLQMSEIEMAHREALLHSNIEQVENERQRFASDLHDELGGIFSTLKLKLNQLDQNGKNEHVFSESREIIDSGIASVRRISHAMTPPGLEMFGLADALENMCRKADGASIKVEFECPEDFPRLPSKIELGIYRIAQELLNNSIRHSGAEKILLHLSRPGDEILFEYSDNGRGINPDALRERKGLGLKNIEARANYLGATVEWQSNPGSGLKTIVKLPAEGM